MERRRSFLGACIALVCFLVSNHAAAPLAADAQQPPKMPQIGYLGAASPSAGAPLLEAFRQGLRELGYVEGQTISIQYRWAEGKPDRFPALAAELIHLRVDVIVTYANTAVAALQQATQTIPIVVAAMGDPVGSGFVASLARPGGNITGFSSLSEELAGKRLELLRETVPKISRIAVLAVSGGSAQRTQWKEIQAAAKAVKVGPQYVEVAGPDEIEHAFATFIKGRAQGLIVLPRAVTVERRAQIVALAAKHRLPGIYSDRLYVEAGGLMSYGRKISDLHRQAATYVDKILKGAKPADLPVQQPMRFDLVLNLKTAKTLGIKFPPSIMVRTDQMIE
jgi:putative ABC transport system substrate-binding protein